MAFHLTIKTNATFFLCMKSCILKASGICLSVVGFFSAASAATSGAGPSFTIDEGVDFKITNSGSSHFVFAWSDPGSGSSSFSDKNDPTLVLTAGETYTFERTTSAHPFVIMDSSAGSFMSGSDGSYARETTNSTTISNAILTPTADFTSNPGGGDLITWTPTASDAGDYWYTCSVTSHTGMAGAITVVPEPGALALLAGCFALSAVMLQRRR